MRNHSTAALLLVLSAGAAFAQTTTAKPATTSSAAKPAVHHYVPKKPVVCAEDAQPVTPAGLPAVTGKFKSLYTISLKYIDTEVGTGELAPDKGFFTVKYTGYLAADGKKFDSSEDHPGKEPITFPVGSHRVIPGWDTGFTGMHIGGKRRLYIPYELAYGDSGRPPVIPPKSDLIFDIELVSVSDKPPAPKPRPEAPKPPDAAKPGEAPKPAEAAPAAKPAAPPATTAPTVPPTASAAPPAATSTAPAPDTHATPQSAPAQK